MVQKFPQNHGAVGSEPDRIQRVRASRLYLHYVNEVLNGILTSKFLHTQQNIGCVGIAEKLVDGGFLEKGADRTEKARKR